MPYVVKLTCVLFMDELLKLFPINLHFNPIFYFIF